VVYLIKFHHPQTQIGVAGVAKGWIVDALYWKLLDMGYENFFVNIGGDLRAAGKDLNNRPWQFHIADPRNPDNLLATLHASDISIATSGNYSRYRKIRGKKYGHILDPRTGFPPPFHGSVTVLTRDTAMADALATAFFVMGPDTGIEFAKTVDGVEVVFATKDGLKTTLKDNSLTPITHN